LRTVHKGHAVRNQLRLASVALFSKPIHARSSVHVYSFFIAGVRPSFHPEGEEQTYTGAHLLQPVAGNVRAAA